MGQVSFGSKIPPKVPLKTIIDPFFDDNNDFKILEVCDCISCILLSSPMELLVEQNCSRLCKITITEDSRETERNLCCLYVIICNLFDLSHLYFKILGKVYVLLLVIF